MQLPVFPNKPTSLTAPGSEAAWGALKQLDTTYRQKKTGFFSYHTSTKIRKLTAIRNAANAIKHLNEHFNQRTLAPAQSINIFILAMSKAINLACQGDSQSFTLKTNLITTLKDTLISCFEDTEVTVTLDDILKSTQSSEILTALKILVQIRAQQTFGSHSRRG